MVWRRLRVLWSGWKRLALETDQRLVPAADEFLENYNVVLRDGRQLVENYNGVLRAGREILDKCNGVLEPKS